MITWNYLDAEVYPNFNNLENVIVNVSWTCNLVENGNVVSLNGKTGLDVDNLGEDCIILENITYEIIDQWVKNKLGSENVLSIEQSLTKKMNDVIDPPLKKVTFSFENTTEVSQVVEADTSNEDPGYTDRELAALGIGTT